MCSFLLIIHRIPGGERLCAKLRYSSIYHTFLPTTRHQNLKQATLYQPQTLRNKTMPLKHGNTMQWAQVYTVFKIYLTSHRTVT